MILGIYGYSKSGKTAFLERLFKELKDRNISAAAIKHAGPGFVETLVHDSGRLAKAGYDPVVLITDKMVSIRIQGFRELEEMIRAVKVLFDVDLIIIEGFKNASIEKIAIGEIEELPGTVMSINSIQSKGFEEQFDKAVIYITDHLAKEKEGMNSSCPCNDDPYDENSKSGGKMSDITLKILVNGEKVPTNEFVESIYWETMCGMVRSLKGVDKDIKSIEILASKE